MVTITLINGEKRQYEKGTTYMEISKQFQSEFASPIVAVKQNNEIKELTSVLTEDCNIELLDLSNKDGNRIYQKSLSFLLLRATRDLLGECRVSIEHSISKGIYCELHNGEELTEELLEKIENQMKKLVEENISFEKVQMKNEEAIKIFKQNGMEDKVKLFRYRRESVTNLYKLGWLYNYFYGYMVPSTGYLQKFKLTIKKPGFILKFPTIYSPTEIPEHIEQPKLFNIFREYEHWGEIMKIRSVGDLNELISKGEGGDIIRISEALQEKKIAYIADMIEKRKETVGMVLIAGPSSSGKTTFARRLSVQLRASGLNPHPISLDDYFVDREHTPRDENGKYDFEALEAIDVPLFNEHLEKLLKGETVHIPTFNFKTGSREYNGNLIKLNENDILVIEGIHGLNEKLTASIKKENKFKIYISALTQLNIDSHNRISTTDTRIIRRMVRDNNFRGHDAAKTIDLWPSVRKGEEKNIFPYQEEADVIFNSALVYEVAVLKQYVEPLLYNIDKSMPQYAEAKRILKFTNYFLGVSSEQVPTNSIVREMIGGSCFNV